MSYILGGGNVWLKCNLSTKSNMVDSNHIYNVYIVLYKYYHNPSLGLATKARANKGAGQEWSPRVKFHVPESVRKCERMNPTHSQVSSHFGSWSLDGLLNL